MIKRSGFILSAAVLILLLYQPAASLSSPEGPVLYSNTDGFIELFWFYPGLHAGRLGHPLDISPHPGQYPSSQDRQYALLTIFEALPPVKIDTLTTFIWNEDILTGKGGREAAPIGFGLYLIDPDSNLIMLCHDLKSLQDPQSVPGEFASLNAGTAISCDFEFITALEWQAGSPTRPRIGIVSGGPYLEQYFCPFDQATLALIPAFDNFFMSVSFLSWRVVGDEERVSFDEVTNFEVYFSEDSLDFGAAAEKVGEALPDTMHAVLNLNSDGYLSIAAWHEEQAEYSDAIPFKPDKKLPLIITPPSIIIDGSGNGYGPFTIEITNIGESALPLRIHYDNNKVNVMPDNFGLSPGDDISLTVYVNDSEFRGVGEDDYLIISSGLDFYPLIYYLRSNQSTSAAEFGSSDRERDLPEKAYVGRACPNPFNSSVTFRLALSSSGELKVTVYDLLGREVIRELVIGEGSSQFTWDGRDGNNRPVASGVYFFKFSGEDFQEIRKAVLLK
jgi:hypothetical protein